MENSYANKQILVVDDFSEFRRSLVQMLEQLGARHIDQAGTGEDAIEMCQQRSYHIILCDYNLGEGKDGQALHEELISRKLISSGTLFVMVTAEDSMAMVLASLECEPDAYLTKPFGRTVLQSRLDRILVRKAAMSDVFSALDEDDPREGIVQCDAVMAKQPRLAMTCQRIKADLHLKLGEWKQAKAVFGQVLKKRALPWALVGKGKTLYNEGEHEAAKDCFNEAIVQNSMYLPAYDWLAKNLVKLGDMQTAQKTLERAVHLSSKAVPRQVTLGDLAQDNQDTPAAVKAYRQVVKFGRYTHHRSPDHAITLAQCLADAMTSASGLNNKRMADEALKNLRILKQDYIKQPEVLIRADLKAASVLEKSGQSARAEETRANALKNSAELPEIESPQTYIELARAFVDSGQEERGQTLLEEALELHQDNNAIRNQVAEMIADKKILQCSNEAAEQNSIGVKFFEQKRYGEATEAFLQALKLAPKNASYLLNATQTALETFNLSGDERAIDRALSYLAKLRSLAPNDYRYARFQELLHLAAQAKSETRR